MTEHKIIDLLSLTSQQSDILNTIKSLQEKEIKSTPINIEKEYLKERNTFIQKSNLFAQLKVLIQKNIIIKNRGNYILNPDGIKETLVSQKNKLSEEVDIIRDMIKDSDKFFSSLAKSSNINVIYLEEDKLYQKLAFYLNKAKNYYLGCDFPHYAYNFSLCRNAKHAAYIEALNSKILDSNFKFYGLTTYKTDAIVHQIQHKNKNIIIEEINKLNENLIDKTTNSSNIDLRKSNAAYDFALIEDEEQGSHVFMFFKDVNRIITGGIMINSYETSKQVKQHFLTQMANNPMLKDKQDFPDISNDIILSKGKQDKVIAFDVNRIFTDIHTTIDLASLSNKKKEVEELINKQIEGEITLEEVLEKLASLLKGIDVNEIKKLVPKIKLMKNVKKGIEKLQKEGYYLVGISTGFSHVITPICNLLGIEEVFCNILEEKNNKLTGRILERNVITTNVKYYIVKYIIEKYSAKKTVAVGDGFSDLDMLKAANLKIAFNPSNKMIKLYKEKSPLINELIITKDFIKLTETILKRT